MSREAASSSPLVPDYLRLERLVCVALQHCRSPVARQLPGELVHLILSFLWSPLTSVSRQLDNPRQRALWSPSLAICTGWIHGDTAQYDEWTGELRGRVMAGWRLRAIDCWGDRYVNGFSFTYSGPGGETWSSEVRKGSHHRPSVSRLQLSSGEHIVQVAVRLSKWMECCVFETSAGRRFQVGGRGSRWAPKEKHASEWTHAGVTQLLLMPQPPKSDGADAGCTYEALAFTYGLGGHVHNLGVYYQKLTPSTPPAAASVPASVQPAPPTPSIDDDAAAVAWSSTSYQSHPRPHPLTTRLPLLSSS